MLNLKKTAVAVLAFSSSAVFAGTMGPVCSAVNVTIPCESTSWLLGGKALYLSTNTGHGSNTITTSGGSEAGTDIGPKYGWGFMIEGAYNFGTGNDININWYHINNGNHHYVGPDSFSGSSSAYSSPSATSSLSSVSFGSNGYLSVGPHWDAVDIEFGQHVDFGENNSVRFHAGFDWARVGYTSESDQNGSATTLTKTSGAATTYAFNNNLTYQASYNGFGPRLGSDWAYDWGNGLGMYANGAMGLLAGTSKNSGTFLDVNSGLSVTETNNATIVVPELEGKLGLTYDYATSMGDLTLDVGWMWVNYFNALKASTTLQGGATPTDVNFGLEGPYVGARWVGNVA